jgi:DNA adenine methylase
MRSPFKRVGGKSHLVHHLLRRVPDHREYIEPYFGAGALFFAKEPAAVETINDLDEAVVSFFSVLRENREEFVRLAGLTPYSRALHARCRATWRSEPDPVRRAWKWWVVARMSCGGDFRNGGWGYVRTTSRRGMAEPCSAMFSAVEGLPEVAERLLRTQIECADGVDVLRRYCTPDSFAYCDPPYVAQTRRRTGGYTHEMSVEQHAALAKAILELPGKIMLSCYWHEVYEPLVVAGWRRIDIRRACPGAARARHTRIEGAGAASSKQHRIETLLLNYDV